MTEKERISYVHGNLFAYRYNKRMVNEFVEKAMQQNGKRWDSAGTHGSFKSDPSARGGIMLADPPKRIRDANNWCMAVEDAWAECLKEDAGDKFGLAYILETYFCLTGDRRDHKKNDECIQNICATCGISESTFYARKKQITGIVCYHAARRGMV